MDTTVAKAFLIVEALASSQRPRGVTELATELSMTKANVHRLMRTLSELGYVRQPEGSSRYEPSMKLWSLGASVVDRTELTTTASPIVRALRDTTLESVQLAVRDGDCIVYVDKADSDRPVRATTKIGSRVPVHCVSTGKAILAALKDPFAPLDFPLKRSTPRTVTTKGELEAQIAEIRRCGYAVNRGEWREEVWGLAAAIVDARNEAVGAIGIWGPAERFAAQALAKHSKAVMAAAAEISEGLGGIPQPVKASKSSKRKSA